jgi:hypothetical protein
MINRTTSLDTGFWKRKRDRGLTAAGDSNVAGVIGSNLASIFIRDAVIGADSLDIITIGDSNAGYNNLGDAGGGGGWTRGLLRGLTNAGASIYGSHLHPTVSATLPDGTGYTQEDNGSITSLSGFRSGVTSPGTNNVLRGSAQSGISTLINALTPVDSFAGLPNQGTQDTGLMPYGKRVTDFAWVAAATTSQSFNNLFGTNPFGATPSPTFSWCASNTQMRYRVTYGRTSTSGGSIVPSVYSVPGYSLITSKSMSTFNAGGQDIVVDEVLFTMPSNGNGVQLGWNYIGTATGPAAVAFESVYKAAKGVAAHNLHYGSGWTTAQIATVVNGQVGSGRTFLQTYFKQIVSRQISAGGSGRVLIWINSGINGGGDTGTTWTTNVSSMINTLRSEWQNAGYNTDNLVFVCSLTHPLNAFPSAPTISNLSSSRLTANNWASAQTNTAIVDLSQLFTPAQMTSNNYYYGTGNDEAHLKQAGYFALGSAIVNRLLACV